MIRYWIEYWYGAAHCSRTVDLAIGDLEAGMDPIAVMWQELEMDVGAPLRLGPGSRAARILRRYLIEEDTGRMREVRQ